MEPEDLPVAPPEADPSSFIPPAGGASDEVNVGTEPSLLYAVIGGSFVALVLAIVWASITAASDTQYGIMAIAVGFGTGAAVRYFGRGETATFGMVGAFLSLASCLAGNILSVYWIVAKRNSWSIFQALFQVDLSRLLSLLTKNTGGMDLFFYALAVIEGYRFSFLSAAHAGRPEGALFGSLMKPSLARFRKPLLVVAGLLTIGGIFSLKNLSSGPVTLTYKSGSNQATGVTRAGKPHGLWTYFSEKGAVLSKLNYVDGELEGAASWWSAEGKLSREGAFRQGHRHGEWKYYDDKGTVVARGRFAYGRETGAWEYRYAPNLMSKVCRYALGVLDGESVSWYPNGKKSERGAYQDGEKIGIWKTWDSAGLPLCEFRYEGDSELVMNCWTADHAQTVKDGNGTFVSYYFGGQVNEKGEVKDGRRTGVWQAYHPNGKMRMKVRWEGDTPLVVDAWNDKGEPLVRDGNGTYVGTLETGKTPVKGDYKNGRQDGEWTTYYPESGAVMHVVVYAGGSLEGPLSGFFASGAKESQGSFKNNQREGEWTWYHENGAVSTQIKFVNGKKDGQQVFYNSQGKKVRVETYKDGVLVAEKDLI